MLRKLFASVLLAAALLLAGCHHSKVQNPIANIDSKQPDKVLYDRAMDAMKHGKYTVARTLLQTLINTYPDSEYLARAKLSVGDSWYAEGGSAALQQAEAEYKDFITFFPQLPEAAEAQLKVANIHYRQMEKPDRDSTQAMRAADEYKALIQNFPDSKLVPEAKQRLREVQEVLAERQSRIAHFYYLRDNMAASQARLMSLVQSYPLYSGIDEALFALGSIYERQSKNLRGQRIAENVKEKLAADMDKKAIDAYSLIVTRYPAMGRADDARKRLADLHAPIPTPTPEAIAESKAEEDGRDQTGRFGRVMGNFKKHPDVAKATKAGEPNVEEEAIVSAPQLMKDLQDKITAAMPQPAVAAAPATGTTSAASTGGGDQKLGVEGVRVGTGPAPGANQPPPGSQNNQQPAGTTPPPQTNELQGASSTTTDQSSAQGPQNGTQQNANDKDKNDSSSKKKGKKGLRKLIPF